MRHGLKFQSEFVPSPHIFIVESHEASSSTGSEVLPSATHAPLACPLASANRSASLDCFIVYLWRGRRRTVSKHPALLDGFATLIWSILRVLLP